MWLIAIGQRRNELSCLDIYHSYIYHSYRQRFDLEHFLRFGKQRLLMAAFQTPEVDHEENWIQFLRGELLQPRLKRAFSAVGLKYEDYCVF